MSPSPDSQGEEDEDDQAPRAEQGEQNEDEGEVEMDEERDRSVSAPPRKAVSQLRKGDGTLIYPRRWLDLKGEVIPSGWEKSVRCVIGWIMARPTSEVSLSLPFLFARLLSRPSPPLTVLLFLLFIYLVPTPSLSRYYLRPTRGHRHPSILARGRNHHQNAGRGNGRWRWRASRGSLQDRRRRWRGWVAVEGAGEEDLLRCC